MPFHISETTDFLGHLDGQEKGSVANATESWIATMLVAINQQILLSL